MGLRPLYILNTFSGGGGGGKVDFILQNLTSIAKIIIYKETQHKKTHIKRSSVEFF